MSIERNVGVSEQALHESQEGRLPLLDKDRIWNKNGPFLWTTFIFAAATWALITGGLIGMYADFTRGAGSFFAGHSMAFMLVVLAVIIPCARYGVDAVDYAKTQFGPRGAQFVLIAIVTTLLGWGGVILVMGQQGVVTLWNHYLGDIESRYVQGIFGLVLLFACWAFVVRGPVGFTRAAKWVGPGLVILMAVMFVSLVAREGWGIFTAQPAPMDPPLGKRFSYALLTEWAFGYGFSWWNAGAAYGRLSSGPRRAWWVMFLSWSALHAVIVMVAILAGVVYGQSDPTLWMIPLLGLLGGIVALAFIIIANWTSIAGLIYIAGVALHQYRPVRRIPWWVLCALIAAPGVYLVFWPEWYMTHFTVFLAYNAILLGPIAAVQAVDYWLLRKGELDVKSMFARGPGSRYWFWGGFNPVALGSCAAAFFFYLWLFDPISTEHRSAFEYLTASLPSVLLAGGSYWLVMRAVVIPVFGKGGYPQRAVPEVETAATLET